VSANDDTPPGFPVEYTRASLQETLSVESSDSARHGFPQPVLVTRDVIAIIVGLVIGAGIFQFPPIVASNSESELVYYGLWVAGGLISLVGALCYAELATAYPNAGGDYYFLSRAYGRNLSFLFAWARIAVIITGSIAILGYTFGNYASNLLPLGPHSSSIYAVLALLVLTGMNMAGIRETKGTQNLLTALLVIGVLAVVFAGLVVDPAAAAPAPTVAPKPWTVGAPFAILFVLFTYSGWNEGAYVSAELKEQRSMVTALVASLLLVTAIYLAMNYAYARALGLAGVAKSSTVAADVLRLAFGEVGSKAISLIIAVAALTSINATIIVGARSNYALGRDWPVFAWLGQWHDQADAPRNALAIQGVVALALIIASEVASNVELAANSTRPVTVLVEYTTPVFWFFIMLVGIGLFVLRVRDPDRPRPFRVPLYPLTPLVFVATCAFLLYKSLTYVTTGAWLGVGVLAVGVLLLAVNLRFGGGAAASRQSA
jgi:APA family basic amino acid/polyamine antiporter